MKLSVLCSPALCALSAAATMTLSTLSTGTINSGPFPDDLNGSNATYPSPIKTFQFTSQGQELSMAFMDVKPTGTPNGKTMLLLHGKNFCASTWQASITCLASKGYRVVAVDQVGFCKSSKPVNYQFSLAQLSFNTAGLVHTLGISTVNVLGHSLGGMLAIHFAAQYPDMVDNLAILDAVGLEDYVAKGVPYIDINDNIAQEAASTYASIRAYEEKFYYADAPWQAAYDSSVAMLSNIYWGSQRDAFVKCQAEIIDMVLTTSIVPYLSRVKARTLVMVGDSDHTVIGQWANPAVLSDLGHFNTLGPKACSLMPACVGTHHFVGQGHAPQIVIPDSFHQVLLDFLNGTSPSSCSWEGHCLGTPCTSDSDCSDSLVCSSGMCSELDTSCSWAGHCQGATCGDDNDCADPFVCSSGRCT